jgi:pimeloyl-ACP methyl ester carboxylesterase
MHYKTKESETAYLAAYKAAMKSWPVPWEEIEVTNRFGTTYAIVSGSVGAPPLILLHGFFTTLLLWTPNIADLSRSYRVYAIDIMGNRNRSIPHQPIGTSDDIVEWLSETLNDLSLQNVYLAGMSYGGWLGINFALAKPERVIKLILIAPAASLLPLVKQFIPRAILSSLPPKKFWFYSFMGWMGLKRGPGHEFSQSLLDMMWLGGENIKMSAETMRVMPTVYSDEELGALKMPVLLLIGENEVIYNAAKAMVRARRLIPHLTGELVPNCGHDISFSQHEFVDGRVLTFLDADLQDRKL